MSSIENDLKDLLDRIKSNSIIQSILTFLNFTWNSFYQSPHKFTYIGSIVLGLGFARFIDVILLYTIANQLGAAIPTNANNQNSTFVASNNQVFVFDPSQVIGGILFAPEPPAAPVAIPNQDPTIPTAEAKDFMLVGTLSGDPSFARAVLQVFGADEPIHEYATKEVIGIDKIILIERDYIVLKRNDVRIKLPVGMKMSEVVAQLATIQTTAPNKDDSGGNTVRKTLSRQEVNKVLKGNSSQIYKGASFGPILENDVIIGYKIHKVESDHFFYQLGARNGDIIKKVNGFELKDTERMFELWNSMKDATNVQIELERGGKMVKYDFNIHN